MNKLQLRDTVFLNGEWIYKLDEKNIGIAQGWYKNKLRSEMKLTVPGCIQSSDEIADIFPSKMVLHNSYLSHFWLEKEIDLPIYDEDKKYWLNFGGIAPAAHVWVNSEYIGFYDDPQIEVIFDVTKYILIGTTNRITVLISEQNAEHLGGLRSSGFDWSGLYRDVTLEVTSTSYIKNISIDNASDDGFTTIGGSLFNENKNLEKVTVLVNILDNDHVVASKSFDVSVKESQSNDFCMNLDISHLEKWSTENPKLYNIEVSISSSGASLDRIVKRTGFRTFTTKGTQILLNGEPFIMRGVGHEYFSVSISPIVDLEIIRQRFLSMKVHGFNFCRFHTHPPTEEELMIADEIGIILSSEIALVSNFSKVSPAEKCLTLIEKHIHLTKHHPSIGIYCLGNEGSQLMVNSYLEREKAKVGYELIKNLVPNHLAMISFGLQGEVPELPNDIESPHLWSHDFLWAYDGLSDIPWDALTSMMNNKPWVIHEYGKFGVWPNPKEVALYPKNGYNANFGWQGKEALKEIGLQDSEDLIIYNSRKLASICNRNIIEGARRQKTNSGYVVWGYFRKGVGNSGFIDDLGLNPDIDPDYYKSGCNAPVALLIDRDFIGRTLKSKEDTKIGAHISNFGNYDIVNATINWVLESDGHTILEGEIQDTNAELGYCTKIADITVSLPAFEVAQKLSFKLVLEKDGMPLSQNSWDFWVFPMNDEMLSSNISYDFLNTDYKFTFKNKFFGSINLRELDSVIRGCRSWMGMDIEKTFEVFKPKILVTDHYSDLVKQCLAHGITVMLLDNSNFKEEWYTKPSVPHLKDEDTARFFTSFRSGWDQGNLATIIKKNELIKDFPCEEFCDLQFYKMINGARTVSIEKVMEDVGATDKNVLIRSIAKTRPVSQVNAVVQDPNAVKELEVMQSRNIYAMDRVFLAELKIGNSKLILNTLRIFDDPAGDYLMRKILKNFK